eukprot:13620188-Alexandrium_andersonii.AAC.1
MSSAVSSRRRYTCERKGRRRQPRARGDSTRQSGLPSRGGGASSPPSRVTPHPCARRGERPPGRRDGPPGATTSHL